MRNKGGGSITGYCITDHTGDSRQTLEQFTVIAVLTGVASVFIGLFTSLEFDTPSGSSIVISNVLFFFLMFILSAPKSYALR